jgi:hypothetical protein
VTRIARTIVEDFLRSRPVGTEAPDRNAARKLTRKWISRTLSKSPPDADPEELALALLYYGFVSLVALHGFQDATEVLQDMVELAGPESPLRAPERKP